MRRLTFIAILVIVLVFTTASSPSDTISMKISKNIVSGEETSFRLEKPGKYGSAHKHLYFKTSIANRTVDFSEERFQLESKLVHFENGNGEILHVHAENIDLGMFLNTLDMDLNDTCVSLEEEFCTNKTHELRVYVNGRAIEKPESYVMEQDDNILVWYGRKGDSPKEGFFRKSLPKEYRPSQNDRNI